MTSPLLGRLVGAALLGVVVGVVGTGVHRASPPFGLLLALAAVLSASVLVRAWAGRLGLVGLVAGLGATVSLLGRLGPGGDLLIAAQPVGYAWYAAVVLVVVAAALPSRWFSDRPIGHTPVSGSGT